MSRKGRQLDTGLAHLSNEQIKAVARNPDMPKPTRKRYQREEKARGLRNKQRRIGS